MVKIFLMDANVYMLQQNSPEVNVPPRTLVNPNRIPKELWRYPQFVCWRYEPNPDPAGKLLKIPKNPYTLGNAGPHWSNTWSTIHKAVSAYKVHPGLAGIGFVLTSGDPYVAVDLDDCLVGDSLDSFAGEIVDTLGTYTEISPSYRGLRLIVRCSVLPQARKVADLGFEVYSTARFVTLTGNVFRDNPIAEFDDLDWLIQRFAPLPPPRSTPTPVQQEHFFLPVDDAALWERMFQNKKVGYKIRRLFDGVSSDYKTPSEADLALCAHLLYWTRGDTERVDRMFRQSGLYRPDRWDRPARAGETYGQGTIDRAVSQQRYTCGGAK